MHGPVPFPPDIIAAVASAAAKYDRVALVLQGGGALGAYQAGVYEALAKAGADPGWISGVSIGGINAALIAGNKPENRLAALINSGTPSPAVRCGLIGCPAQPNSGSCAP